ncbi:MAG: hypothetical protein K2H43_07095, partial [Clostridia bacterium]|nr:hypothetical protein [Clostridia bacterium]
VLTETHEEMPVDLSEDTAKESAAGAESSEPTPAMIRERHETMSYTFSFSAKIIQLKPQAKEWYSRLKNELLSYGKVRVRMGNRYESFLIGRRTVARLTVRGKTLCLLLAADPAKYADSKFSVEENKTNTPCLYRIKNDMRVRYACKLIEELMAETGAIKRSDYEPQDYYQPYEGLVTLMNKGLVKRNLNSSEKTYRIVEVEEDKPGWAFGDSSAQPISLEEATRDGE